MATILIVDDSASNRSIYARLATMVNDNIITETFAQPLDALEWLEHNTVDLIITDFSMPQLDGAAFTKRVRALPTLARTPILVVTAHDDRSFRLQALDAGATDFLQSPIDHFEFVTRARNLLALSVRVAGDTEALWDQARLLQPIDPTALARLLDLVPVLISVTNQAGIYLYANLRFATSLGMTSAEIPGCHVTTLLGPERGAISQAHDHRVLHQAEALATYVETWPPSGAGQSLVSTHKQPIPAQPGDVVAVLTTSWPLPHATPPSSQRADAA